MKGIVFSDTIGWIEAAPGRRGVVIAGAHGHEDLCSRRFLRLLSDRAAAAGLPALQFDYPGCGDAAGDHATPHQVAGWIAAIGAAIDRLKQDCGVKDVILVGFRLGALLAPLAAEGRDDVAGLALLAPPASGKAHVREIVAMSRMIDGPLAGPSGADASFPEGREAAGFRLTHETLADLKALDWRQALAALPALPTLVLANGRPLPAAEIRADAAAAAVETGAFEGYHLMMGDPTASRISTAALDRCAAWLARHAVAGRGTVPPTPPHTPAELLLGPHYTEEPVMIGPAPRMYSVLTRPRGRAAAADPVIFLNAGGVPHVGWARGAVEAARDLAAAGVASLRIDLPGLGQSDAAEDGRLFLYDARTGRDVGRAIDWMESNGFPSVGLAGICAGGFQAFHAARADRRVRALTMVNPLCFAWNASYALDMALWKTDQMSRSARAANQGGEAAPAEAETAPAKRRSAPVRWARRLVRMALETAKLALSALDPSAIAGGRRVERWMRELGEHGVRVLVVTSEGDLSHREIARHFGPGGERLSRMAGVSRLSLPDADHTLTPHRARRALTARLIADAGADRPAQQPAPAAKGR